MWVLDNLEKLKNSDKPAIIHREKGITFKELWERSERVANYILSTCKTKSPILIYGNKEIDIITVMIACLKTGRAYSPVDITYPSERLYKIAKITNTELVFNFSNVELSGDFKILNKDEINGICSEERKQEEISIDNWVKDEDTCYILFTSGSTGEPKGVQISKKNIECFASYFKNECEISGEKIVLNQPPYSFDLSVINPYVCLPMGMTLYNIDKDMIENPKEMFEYFKKSNISIWISTPSFLNFCIMNECFNKSMFPNLKKFIFNGEVLPKNLVKIIFKKFPNSVVINAYGPTEATVGITSCVITKGMLEDEKSLPVGKISPNMSYKIVDESGNSVKEGQPGELIIIGDSVSSGYYKDLERTEKSFFVNEEKKRCYKTGDLVFKSGEYFYFIARKDFQIKLNGFRIELDDIASNLNKTEFVNNSVVMPVYKDESISYLVAFVTLNKKTEESDFKIGIKIKKELRDLVPSYMVPKKIKILDSFPLNTNGKIDRKKLMEEM